MRLSAKLEKWVDNKIITPEQRVRILELENQDNSHLFWKTAFIIAGMLMGLGICLIVAANWDVLPDGLKLIGDLILFAAVLYGVFQCIYRQERRWKEFFLILAFLMVGATIGLTGQIYNLDGGWQSFAMFWSLLSLPYVILSRSMTFNIIWLCLFFNLFDDGILEKILTYISDNLDGVIYVAALLSLLSYAGKKLDKAISSRLLLPKAFSALTMFIAYIVIFWGGAVWGLGGNGSLLQSWLAHTFVFGFLFIRMLKALKEQNIQSFKHNAAGMEIYIFILFVSRFGDLLSSGIGFIIAGGLILVLIYLLKKTTASIKRMEIFK